jgi:hypothetical protein
MLKSADKADAMLKDIRKFAAETPFNNTELTDASRKLIAYGLSAEQVIPTLRTLGDVSAATQTSVGDLAYLYGTLAAQQRAYSRDIYQFANRGIPICEALARVLGKSVAEVKDLVEEGKCRVPEVVKAFKSMTEGKGIYAGLTARQADTFAGVREQLVDALQVGKIKFGKILIEELGLKEGAKDLTKFVENLENHLDRIRPAVRFVGELGRAAAQVASEFGKAAVNVSDIGFQAIGRAFPGLKDAADSLHSLVKDAQNFKIDTEQLTNTTLMFTKTIVLGVAEIIDAFEEMGKGIKKDFIDPLNDAIKRMDLLKAFADRPLTVMNAKIMQELGIWDNSKPLPKAPENRLPVVPGTIDEIIKDWMRLNEDIRQKHVAWQNEFSANRQSDATREAANARALAIKARDDFANRWGGGLRDISNSLDRKIVPARQLPSGEILRPAAPGGAPVPKTPQADCRGGVRSVREGASQRLHRHAVDRSDCARDARRFHRPGRRRRVRREGTHEREGPARRGGAVGDPGRRARRGQARKRGVRRSL